MWGCWQSFHFHVKGSLLPGTSAPSRWNCSSLGCLRYRPMARLALSRRIYRMVDKSGAGALHTVSIFCVSFFRLKECLLSMPFRAFTDEKRCEHALHNHRSSMEEYDQRKVLVTLTYKASKRLPIDWTGYKQSLLGKVHIQCSATSNMVP